MAPNLHVTLDFHQPPGPSEFLLLDAVAPLATGDTIGVTGQVWSDDRRLLATAIQQLLARPAPQA
jgi:acyl-CoA thioesterase